VDETAEVVAVSVESGKEVFFEITDTQANRQASAWHQISADKDLQIADAGTSIEVDPSGWTVWRLG